MIRILALNAFAVSALLCMTSSHAVLAQERPDTPFKLSYGAYRYSDRTTGQDLNLRWETPGTHLWIGHYEDQSFGHQTRVGFDRGITLNEAAQLQVSMQLASSHFFGASVQLALGDPFFVLAGLGRTNLKPYYNLNFDPNDSVTLGLGWRVSDQSIVALSVVADNRLGTGQQVWHLSARNPVSQDLRLTVDLNYKDGTGPDGPVHGWGLTTTLDFRRWFARLALDQKQNFEKFDAMRLTAGLRF
jgi:hypothetical protein